MLDLLYLSLTPLKTMTEKYQINLFNKIEKGLNATEHSFSSVKIVIYYHIDSMNYDFNSLPVKLVAYIYPLNQSEPFDIDFYYQLADRLTLHFNIFSIDDMEFVFSTRPFPYDEIPPMENRIFQVFRKKIDLDYPFVDE